MIIGTYIPIFTPDIASAAQTQLEPRSIHMSDSAPSSGSIVSGVGSGTGVNYTVSITNADTFNSLVIDFCDNSPIIGDTCLLSGETAPGQTTHGSGGLNVTGTGFGSGDFATTSTCTSTHQLTTANNYSITTPTHYTVEIKNTGTSNTVCAGTQTFTLTGITNPQTTGTFYARIYTFSSDNPTTQTPNAYSSPVFTSGTAPTYTDYGGIALSTVPLINISAKVQESLSFCVTSAVYSTWTTTGDCSDPAVAASPALTLGQTVGSNIVLQPEHHDIETDTFQVSTNATTGAVIDMRTTNACGGLSDTAGATCGIPSVGFFETTAPASPGGQPGGGGGTEDTTYDLANADTNDLAMFGMQLGTATTGTSHGLSGTGTLNDIAPYNGTGTVVGLDDSTATTSNGVTSDYGSLIANTNSSACYLLTDTISFGATSALTTPAGIYSTNEDLIATGTF